MGNLQIADRLSWIAGALAAIAAGVGLFVTGLYRDTPFWAQQAQGTDVATLFLAVPILFGGLWAARAGSHVGRLSAIAGILYLMYNYAIFAFAVELNPLLAVYIGILSLAVWSLILTLVADRTPRTLLPSLPRRTTAGVLTGVAVVFALLWLSQIAGATFTGEIPVDLERAELPTNPVWTLDLGFFLPLCVVAGVGLIRRSPAIGTFALPMLIWLFLTSVGIVAAFVLATSTGEPFPIVAGGLVSIIGILTGGLAAYGVLRAEAAKTTAGRSA